VPVFLFWSSSRQRFDWQAGCGAPFCVLDLDLLPGVSFSLTGVIDSGLEENESRAAQKTKSLSPFLAIYMAFRRKHPDAYTILLTNILLAWTGEGWIVLWIWVPASGQNQKGSKKGGSNGKIA
jgi:hypothetical protein